MGATHDWTERRPQTVKEIVEILHDEGRAGDTVCRGQAAEEWDDLSTSFDRMTEQGRPFGDLVCDEVACLEMFRRRAANWLSPAEASHLRTLLGTMQLLRHYGGPTRLLDWTTSPWVAVYFACQAARVGVEQSDGVIWRLDLGALLETQRSCGVCAEELRAIREATTGVEWGRAFSDQADRIYVIDPDYENPRVIAQQGLFTLSRRFHARHDVLLAAAVPAARRERLVIRSELKGELIRSLHFMNLTPATLFPGPDGLARAIEHSLRWDTRRPVNEDLRRLFR